LEKTDNQEKFLSFREKFAFFSYENFEYQIDGDFLSARFLFNMSDKYSFRPEFKIGGGGCEWGRFSRSELETLVFHVGMVELVSYWKTFCPKKVNVKPFLLDEKQIEWWRNLYYNGLGEFFYLNSISVPFDDFMTIESTGDETFGRVGASLSEACVIPVGGGKDSVVTLETLKDKMDCRPMIVNSRGATDLCVRTAGFEYDEVVSIERKLDPTMLKLNKEGCLNGHTPFSALLAFFSLLAGFATSSKYIALSNESSANESTVPGTKINHQYSKSIEFEMDFRNYVDKYINSEIQYFSFLRPLSEVGIAELFSRHRQYFEVFKSCNVGSKTDSWCCSCPKCLFTWLILSPFVSQDDLIDIFGENMMKNNNLIGILHELEGTSEVKPFECVGTTGEVRACIKALSEKVDLENTILKNSVFNDQKSIDDYLTSFDKNNFLPHKFEQILKKAIRQR